MEQSFTGVALVTNAGCELGEAVALGLVRAGCRRVALADASIDPITSIKDRVLLYVKDVQCLLIELENNEAEDFENMVKQTVSSFGEIDYCINCSTTNVYSKPTAELEPALFLAGLKDTSRALWLCLRAELRQMLSQPRGGKSKNSIVSIVPYGAGGSHPGHAVLAASGYSRIGMIKSMARDHLNDHIRLNAVCPAALHNGGFYSNFEPVSTSKEDQEGNSETLRSHMRIPRSQLIEVDEIANAVLFMASELSSGINGITLPVDGGWTLIHN